MSNPHSEHIFCRGWFSHANETLLRSASSAKQQDSQQLEVPKPAHSENVYCLQIKPRAGSRILNPKIWNLVSYTFCILLIFLVIQSVNSHSFVGARHVVPNIVHVGDFVGAGSLMPMKRYSDQQVPLNSKQIGRDNF